MADRRLGVPAPPVEQTIRSADWDSLDISGEIHRRVLFQDVDLTELSDHGSSFEECQFRNVRFNVSVHEDARFLNCVFSRCSFFDATFTGCKLTGCVFDGCTYGLLKVSGGDWSYVALPGADLRGSTFHGTRLREADLSAARLSRELMVLPTDWMVSSRPQKVPSRPRNTSRPTR